MNGMKSMLPRNRDRHGKQGWYVRSKRVIDWIKVPVETTTAQLGSTIEARRISTEKHLDSLVARDREQIPSR